MAERTEPFEVSPTYRGADAEAFNRAVVVWRESGYDPAIAPGIVARPAAEPPRPSEPEP